MKARNLHRIWHRELAKRLMRGYGRASDSRDMTTQALFADLSFACRDAAAGLDASVVQIQGRPRHPATALVAAPERLVTTSHSVEWDEIAVRHPRGSLTATVAGRDLATDLVLLKVPGLSAPPIRLAARTPDTGELALIVGRSWGGHLKARLTTLTRVDGPIRVGRGRTLERVLNLDTAPYTGFSGSAVVLPDGTVAGISTTGLLRGAGLALTADTIRPTLEALERHGSVKRGFIGITSQPVTIPEAQRTGATGEQGLLVVGVAPATPAAEAGLLVGDILVTFAGTPVSDPEQLLGQLTGDRVGTRVLVTVVRGREAVEVPVTVGERPTRT